MDPKAAILALALSASAPAAALAAPTCWTQDGHVIRCGTPGAMPVGAELTAEQQAARAAADDDGPSPGELLGLLGVLGGMFGLIALMPDFDGWREGD